MNTRTGLFLAMAMMTMQDATDKGRAFTPTPPTKPFVPKDCKEYFFGGVSIVARNYANAEKKARKRGLIP